MLTTFIFCNGRQWSHASAFRLAVGYIKDLEKNAMNRARALFNTCVTNLQLHLSFVSSGEAFVQVENPAPLEKLKDSHDSHITRGYKHTALALKPIACEFSWFFAPMTINAHFEVHRVQFPERSQKNSTRMSP